MSEQHLKSYSKKWEVYSSLFIFIAHFKKMLSKDHSQFLFLIFCGFSLVVEFGNSKLKFSGPFQEYSVSLSISTCLVILRMPAHTGVAMLMPVARGQASSSNRKESLSTALLMTTHFIKVRTCGAFPQHSTMAYLSREVGIAVFPVVVMFLAFFPL